MDLLPSVSDVANEITPTRTYGTARTTASLMENKHAATVQKAQAVKVVDLAHIPEWMKKDSNHIIRSYRAQTNSFRVCYYSLWHFHNETVNTWSHLLMGIFFTILLAWSMFPTLHYGYLFSIADLRVMQWYLVSCSYSSFSSVSSSPFPSPSCTPELCQCFAGPLFSLLQLNSLPLPPPLPQFFFFFRYFLREVVQD
jgi:hypothetical protein